MGLPWGDVARPGVAVGSALSLAVVPGCTSSTAGGVVGADGLQLALVSSAQLRPLADETCARRHAESAELRTLNVDTALAQCVRVIAAQLQPRTAVFRPDAPGWKRDVNVIESQELNAFCMPGGTIMVY